MDFLDDLMKAAGVSKPETTDAQTKLLARLTNAAELSAALEAHRFFTEQENANACRKLSAVIQKRASVLVK